jgi:SAM-dependent methyltransferase
MTEPDTDSLPQAEASDSRANETLKLRYGCDRTLLPADLQARFCELAPDEGLQRYLAEAKRRRLGRMLTGLQWLLCRLLSDFDANALLRAYPMHLLSTAQWQTLLGGRSGGRLLDVGAGSGDVTARLAPLFDAVATTEVSRAMAWRLRQRGFDCTGVDVADCGAAGAPYDAVSCLNVLDRCARPQSLLTQLHRAVAPTGTVLLSVPLPYQPFYYQGPTTPAPSESLPCDDSCWEAGATCLVREVLEPLGFHLRRLARAPYLSGGDRRRSMCELDAAVFVCGRKADPAASRSDGGSSDGGSRGGSREWAETASVSPDSPEARPQLPTGVMTGYPGARKSQAMQCRLVVTTLSEPAGP